MIRGKQAVIAALTLLGIFAIFLGPQLVFQYSEGNVKYAVYLKEFSNDGTYLNGELILGVTNNNDFAIEVRDINLKLFDPQKSAPFYQLNEPGGSLEAGESNTWTKGFSVKIEDIPEFEVRYVISAYVVWNGAGQWVSKEDVIAIEFGALIVNPLIET